MSWANTISKVTQKANDTSRRLLKESYKNAPVARETAIGAPDSNAGSIVVDGYKPAGHGIFDGADTSPVAFWIQGLMKGGQSNKQDEEPSQEETPSATSDAVADTSGRQETSEDQPSSDQPTVEQPAAETTEQSSTEQTKAQPNFFKDAFWNNMENLNAVMSDENSTPDEKLQASSFLQPFAKRAAIIGDADPTTAYGRQLANSRLRIAADEEKKAAEKSENDAEVDELKAQQEEVERQQALAADGADALSLLTGEGSGQATEDITPEDTVVTNDSPYSNTDSEWNEKAEKARANNAYDGLSVEDMFALTQQGLGLDYDNYLDFQINGTRDDLNKILDYNDAAIAPYYQQLQDMLGVDFYADDETERALAREAFFNNDWSDKTVGDALNSGDAELMKYLFGGGSYLDQIGNYAVTHKLSPNYWSDGENAGNMYNQLVQYDDDSYTTMANALTDDEMRDIAAAAAVQTYLTQVGLGDMSMDYLNEIYAPYERDRNSDTVGPGVVFVDVNDYEDAQHRNSQYDDQKSTPWYIDSDVDEAYGTPFSYTPDVVYDVSGGAYGSLIANPENLKRLGYTVKE